MTEKTEKTSEWNGLKTFRWKGFDWIRRPLWGEYHPEDRLSWFDETLPFFSGYDDLWLTYKYKPRQFGDTGNIYRPIARSTVRTTQEFKYGTFEIDVILPEGKWMWPAIWMASDSNWPPEIDILEGWSRENPQYVKGLIYKEVKPTMHWHDSKGTHVFRSRNNILRCRIKGDRQVNKLKCVWTPDYVDIYYNGHKVKRFNDKEMLAEFNKPEYKMHMKFSMAIEETSSYWDDKIDGSYIPPIEETMVVKSFKYTPWN